MWQGRCPFSRRRQDTVAVSAAGARVVEVLRAAQVGTRFRFVELHDKLGFREAVIKLGGSATVAARRTSKEAAKEEAPARPARSRRRHRRSAQAAHARRDFYPPRARRGFRVAPSN